MRACVRNCVSVFGGGGGGGVCARVCVHDGVGGKGGSTQIPVALGSCQN